MNVTNIKLTLAFILFLATFLCSTIPVFFFSLIQQRHRKASNRSQRSCFSFQSLISYISCFGGGIFLGVSLLDLLPEVIHHINFTIKTEFNYDNDGVKRYPFSELFIGLGLFLILFIEQFILSCQPLRHKSSNEMRKKPIRILPNQDEETSIALMNDQDSSIESTKTQEFHFDIHESTDDLATRSISLTKTRNSILILSLIIHSLFEGIALGSTNDEKFLFELFLAIILHKSIIALGLGLKLMKLSEKSFVYFSCFLFSIATSFGVVFVVTVQQFLAHSRTMMIIHDILRAFACGTFFYITFFDILPHELNGSSHHSQTSSSKLNPNRLVKVLCIFLGFSFIGLFSFLMK